MSSRRTVVLLHLILTLQCILTVVPAAPAAAQTLAPEPDPDWDFSVKWVDADGERLLEGSTDWSTLPVVQDWDPGLFTMCFNCGVISGRVTVSGTLTRSNGETVSDSIVFDCGTAPDPDPDPTPDPDPDPNPDPTPDPTSTPALPLAGAVLAAVLLATGGLVRRRNG